MSREASPRALPHRFSSAGSEAEGPEGALRAFFERIDRDGDGQIGLEDLAAALPSFGIGADPVALFESLDVDGDGAVTLEEFQMRAQNFMAAVAGAAHEPAGHEEWSASPCASPVGGSSPRTPRGAEDSSACGMLRVEHQKRSQQQEKQQV